MKSALLIEDGDFGLRVILQNRWKYEFIEFLKNKNIAELELNTGKGWQGEDVSFVELFPNLRALIIIDLHIKSVSAVHSLHEVRRLELITYCKTKIIFSEFPHLEDCGFEWRAGSESLFDCKSLKHLFINNYKGKDTKDFGKLEKIETLAILNSPITNLHGLAELKRLRSLRLANLRNLTSLSGIERLNNLQELDINTCKKISSINEISNLKKLTVLGLNNMEDINSIKSLENLELLRSFGFYESTNIIDGDLTPLTKLKNLSKVAFQNRRHYTHSREFWDK